jgi:hypothetical protein
MDEISDRSRTLDWLAVAAVAFLAANVLHGIDHFRTGPGRLSVAVLSIGPLITAAAVVTVAYAWRGDRRAALVAAAVGLASAVLVANAHLVPHWGILSDSYVDGSFDAFSWTVVIAEVVASLALGLVGLGRLRRGAVAT